MRAYDLVALDPVRALELWTDVRRWPTFIEGFGHALEVSDGWPGEGGKVVWQSIPGGRGRVTERVQRYAAVGADGEGEVVAQVFEEALAGTQAVHVRPEGEGSRVDLRLDYELVRSGPLRKVADLLFIRRALTDAYGRTLRRFATEAEEELDLEEREERGTE